MHGSVEIMNKPDASNGEPQHNPLRQDSGGASDDERAPLAEITED